MKKVVSLILFSLNFTLYINCQIHKQNESMDIKVVFDFIESINGANIEKICNLMSNDHVFIDSQGNEMIGIENMKKAWIGYFELFPDYKIEIMDTIQNDSIIVMLGYASGTYNLKNKKKDLNNHWRIPAAWKAMVVNEKIKLWQVYADNSIVLEILKRNN